MSFCAPQIVYSNGWLNQTSNLGSQTLYTTATKGIFRFNLAIYGTATATHVPGGGSGTLLGEVLYNGSNWMTISGSFGQPPDGGIQANDAEALLAGLPGASFTINGVTIQDPDGVFGSFDLYVVIEQVA